MKIAAVVVLAVLLSSGCVTAWAEEGGSTHQQHRTTLALGEAPTYPAGTIDGSRNPELISDFKAYEVFFNSLAIADSSSEFKKWEAKDRFRSAQLAEADTVILMGVLADFYSRRVHLQGKSNQLRGSGAKDEEFAKLLSEADGLVSQSRSILQSKLSPEGVAKIHAHVMGLKSKIKIIPPPSNQ